MTCWSTKSTKSFPFYGYTPLVQRKIYTGHYLHGPTIKISPQNSSKRAGDKQGNLNKPPPTQGDGLLLISTVRQPALYLV